jgi:hypothetical protein
MKGASLPAFVFLGLALLGAAAPRLQAQSSSVSNFSALLQIPAGGSSPSLGFVVATPTEFLIRAVGPSLSSFGIPNPVAASSLKIFNSSGVDVLNEPNVRPIPVDWSFVYASVGAFPIGAGDADAHATILLGPGAYTVVAQDSSGSGGAVLLEVYVNPALGQTVD